MIVSVVVPVYDTEKFLPKCLDSILGQSYKNLEVILVNDGTPDDSAAIILEYAEKDSRVRWVEHIKNRGLFQARLTGVAAAQGKYLAFVDSDDYISVDYIRQLVQKAEETGADIVCADFFFEQENGKKEYLTYDPIRMGEMYLEKDQILPYFMKQKGLFFGWHTIWNKLYKKDLWNQCTPFYHTFAKEHEPLIMMEDLAFSCVIWSFSQKVTQVHHVAYMYKEHENQSIKKITLEKYKKNIRDLAAVFDFFETILEYHGKKERYQEEFFGWKKEYQQIWEKKSLELELKDQIIAQMFLRTVFPMKISQSPRRSNFFYTHKTKIPKEFLDYENIKQRIVSSGIQYVSFDVFDTLLLRPFLDPKDLFYQLNPFFDEISHATFPIDFSKIRVEGEKQVRKTIALTSVEEVTLDQIYETIGNNTVIPIDMLEQMKTKEVQLEYQLCQVRQSGKELFALAKDMGKSILLVSDMYLSKDIVALLLQKNGYEGYDTLYVSSQVGKCKWTGNLYSWILQDKQETNASVFFHIGDHMEGDVQMAKQQGWQAKHLPKVSEKFQQVSGAVCLNPHYLKKQATVGRGTFLGTVANRFFDYPLVRGEGSTDFMQNPRYLGYFVFGPYLLYTCGLAMKEGMEKNCNRIHFFGAFGLLGKQAYDLLKQTSSLAPDCQVISLPNKGLELMEFQHKIDFYRLEEVKWSTPQKLAHFLKPIIPSIKFTQWKEKLAEENVCSLDPFSSFEEYEQCLKFFLEKMISIDLLKKVRAEIKQVLQQKLMEGDGVVEIISQYRISSFFVKDWEIPVKVLSLLPHEENKEFLWLEKMLHEIVWHKETEEDGSYGNHIILQGIQEEALQFVKDFSKEFGADFLKKPKDYDFLLQPYRYYLTQGKPLDREVLGVLEPMESVEMGKDFLDTWEQYIKGWGSVEQGGSYMTQNRLEGMYEDGLFVAFYQKLNKMCPKGSKQREWMKKLGKKFF